MSTILKHEIHINAPVAQVWDVLADLTAVKYYNPEVLTAEIPRGSESTGIGAKRTCDVKPRGSVVEQVTRWEAQRVLGLKVVESDWPIVYMQWDTFLEASKSGTRMNQTMEYKVKFGLVGKFLNVLVMKRKLNSAIQDVFESLKNYVEKNEKVLS